MTRVKSLSFQLWHGSRSISQLLTSLEFLRDGDALRYIYWGISHALRGAFNFWWDLDELWHVFCEECLFWTWVLSQGRICYDSSQSVLAQLQDEVGSLYVRIQILVHRVLVLKDAMVVVVAEKVSEVLHVDQCVQLGESEIIESWMKQSERAVFILHQFLPWPAPQELFIFSIIYLFTIVCLLNITICIPLHGIPDIFGVEETSEEKHKIIEVGRDEKQLCGVSLDNGWLELGNVTVEVEVEAAEEVLSRLVLLLGLKKCNMVELFAEELSHVSDDRFVNYIATKLTSLVRNFVLRSLGRLKASQMGRVLWLIVNIFCQWSWFYSICLKEDFLPIYASTLNRIILTIWRALLFLG